MGNVTYWQRFLCGTLGALSALCFSAALRMDGQDWLKLVGFLLAVPVLPLAPMVAHVRAVIDEGIATWRAGIQVRHAATTETSLPPWSVSVPPVGEITMEPYEKVNGEGSAIHA